MRKLMLLDALIQTSPSRLLLAVSIPERRRLLLAISILAMLVALMIQRKS